MTPNALISTGCWVKNIKSGRHIAAMSEERETILKNRNTIKNIPIVTSKTGLIDGILKDNPIKAPRLVATPFPPLKPRNTV
jgi:hypothetical protein